MAVLCRDSGSQVPVYIQRPVVFQVLLGCVTRSCTLGKRSVPPSTKIEHGPDVQHSSTSNRCFDPIMNRNFFVLPCFSLYSEWQIRFRLTRFVFG